MTDIQYLGHSCFRIRGRDGIVLCDPYDTSVGLELGRPTAHIVTISTRQPAHNHVAAVRPVRETIFVVDGPGEYEVRGILISGVRTFYTDVSSDQPRFNTVYVVHIDDIACCHLGNLGHELSRQQIEEIGNVDILFIPVGGGESLGPTEAVSVISQLEPRIVIPMRYALPNHTPAHAIAPLEKFTHEIGLQDVELHDKLTLTPSNLPAEGEETRTIVMRPVNT